MRNCGSLVVFCFLQWAAGMCIREGANPGLLQVQKQDFGLAKSPQMTTQGSILSL